MAKSSGGGGRGSSALERAAGKANLEDLTGRGGGGGGGGGGGNTYSMGKNTLILKTIRAVRSGKFTGTDLYVLRKAGLIDINPANEMQFRWR